MIYRCAMSSPKIKVYQAENDVHQITPFKYVMNVCMSEPSPQIMHSPEMRHIQASMNNH